MATKSDLLFIYKSLKEMAIEENLSARFSVTEASLKNALFTKKAYAEVVIAELAGKPVGLCLFSITNRNFNLFRSHGIYIHDVYVLSDYRRKGIGSGLVLKLKELAKERGCDRIDSVVLKENTQAIFFLKKFKEIKKVDHVDYMRAKL